MTAILGRTGNLVGFTTGRGTTPWNTEMEAALRKMDAMLASTVVAITNTLPGSANEGDLYLVGTSPTGVAAGWANRIARWCGSPAGWEAYQPMQGWIITIVGESTNKVRRYDGTAWTPIGNDISMGSISGLSAALAAKLAATNPVVTDTLTTKNIKLSDGGAGVGIFRWSPDEHTGELTLENGSVLQLGKENFQWCKNETGATIPNGRLVYVSNSTGDNPVISLASAASLTTSETIGMTTQDIIDGQHGHVAVGVSFVRNLNIGTGTPGQAIYLTTAGNYTVTPPAKPGRRIRAGFILRQHATAGIILLWIHTNPSVIDINDADSTGASQNDVLRLNASGIWVPGKALQTDNPTFTGALTGPTMRLTGNAAINGASMPAWDAARKPMMIGRTAALWEADYGGGSYAGLSTNYWFDGANSKSLSASGYSQVVLIDPAGNLSYAAVANNGVNGNITPVTKWSVDKDGAMSLNGTLRITAGGGGRLADLKIAELGPCSGTLLMSADANGTVAPSQLTQGWQTIGNIVGTLSLLSGYLHGFSAAGGSVATGGQYWNTWLPSVLFAPSDDTYVNPMPSLYAGGIWHSQISNALTIADGDASTGSRRGYRGRLKADRWVGTNPVSITNTTTATSFFAGTGDGTPTIPVYYLKEGRRGSIKSAIYCNSAGAGSSHDFALNFGSNVVFSRTITPVSSGEQEYRFEGDFFLASTGTVEFVGAIRAYTKGTLWAEYRTRSSMVYTASSSYTLDMTIKPSATTEIWQRALAVVEI